MTKTLRAVVYLRISNDKDRDEHGVDAQRHACLKLAKQRGYEVIAEYKDNDRSAYSRRQRPDFERLMADMAHGDKFDVLIIWSADRLFRRVADLVRICDVIEKSPVQIEQVEGGDYDLTTADGIMNAQVRGALAERESRVKSHRLHLRSEYRVREEQRMISSKLPTGWRWVEPCLGGEQCRHVNKCERGGLRPLPGSQAGIEPDPVEAALVVQCYELIANGGSLNACARMFTEAGVPSRYTDRWKASTMRSMLMNPRNAGLVALKGEVTGEARDGHKIVGVEMWERVQRILTDPARKTAGRPAGTIMSNIARCSECGGPMNASKKERVPVYICGRYQHLSKRRHLVDEFVLGEVRRFLVANAATLSKFAEPSASPVQRKAAAEMEKINDSIATYRQMAVDMTMDPDDVKKVITGLRAKLADAERRAVVASGRPHTASLLAAKDVAGQFDKLAADTNVVPLRALLREVLEKVVIVRGFKKSKGIEVVWAEWVRSATAATAA